MFQNFTVVAVNKLGKHKKHHRTGAFAFIVLIYLHFKFMNANFCIILQAHILWEHKIGRAVQQGPLIQNLIRITQRLQACGVS